MSLRFPVYPIPFTGAVLLLMACGGEDPPTGPTVTTLAVATTSLPFPVEGVPYSQTLAATGGSGGYTWALVAGSLPTGLSLNGSTGEIGGTATLFETQDFSVEVVSGDGQSASKAMSMTVRLGLAPADLCSASPSTSLAAFEGTSLEAAVRIGLAVGVDVELTCALVSSLTSLDASALGITSVVGTQNLTSLRLVLLHDNPNLIVVQSLIDNPGIRTGDIVNVGGTGVSCADVTTLQVRGVSTSSDCLSKIAYSRGGDIYVMEEDGVNPEAFTTSEAIASDPVWSPDGLRISFRSSDLLDIADIYVMDARGGNLANLTNDAARDDAPDWSADGSKILFPSDHDGPPSTFDLYSMDPDGTNVVNLTNDGSLRADPDWSPDGTRIAFTSGGDVQIMDSDGSNIVNLTNDAFAANDTDAAWSPDGSKIAFGSDRDGNREIYVMDADGTNVIRLTNEAAADFDPTWSPDGSRIAFASERDGINPAESDIYLMDADGTNIARLTNDAAIDTKAPAWALSCGVINPPIGVGPLLHPGGCHAIS